MVLQLSWTLMNPSSPKNELNNPHLCTLAHVCIPVLLTGTRQDWPAAAGNPQEYEQREAVG